MGPLARCARIPVHLTMSGGSEAIKMFHVSVCCAPRSCPRAYGVGGVKERGMEVEREGGGQYQALPKGMFPTTVKVNVDREASLDV